ncbi:uncharacterized protein LOC142978631 [Anticarsia gemmatalis]|uniref:uncharacterized protein LOC142978631 n=1 Tax=Anticarsia gemmatalis TaxID=129554 RepID=UPI003F77185F
MKTLCVVIIIFVYLVIYIEAENQVMRIDKNDIRETVSSTKKQKVFTVAENDQVSLIFERTNVTSLNCHKPKRASSTMGGLRVDAVNITYTNDSTIFYFLADKSSNGRWNCHTISSSRGLSFLFDIRVKDARMPKITIDEFALNFKMSNSSVTEYDRFHEFKSEVNQSIELACNHVYDVGSLRLRYYDSQGAMLMNFVRPLWSKEQLIFRQLMTAEYNESYIDCTYITPKEENEQEFTYRTIFIVQDEGVMYNDFIMQVNGVKLAPHHVNGVETYQFRSIYNLQQLTITCEYKNKSMLGQLVYATDNIDSSTSVIKDSSKQLQPWRRSILINTTTTGVLVYRFTNSEKREKFCVIKLTKSLKREPIISRLLVRNILYQYGVSDEEWVNVYRYRAGDNISLVCSTQEGERVRWLFGKYYDEYSRSLEHVFTLSDEHNMSNITCESIQLNGKKKRNIIALQQYLPPLKFFDPEDKNTMIVIVGGAMGALVAIIVGICCFYRCRRNKHRHPRNGPYQTFNDNDNPIPPFPNQWEIYDYAYPENIYTPTTNDNYIMTNNSLYLRTPVYATPHKKRLTITSNTENHYTEIDENFINKIKNTGPTYQIPFEHCDKNKPSSSENDKLQKTDDVSKNIDDNIGYENLRRNKSKGSSLKKLIKKRSDNVLDEASNTYINYQRVDSNTSYSNLIDISHTKDPKMEKSLGNELQ